MPSVQQAACVAFTVIGSLGSTLGTSIRPASAIAAARPRAGSAARAPAVSRGTARVSSSARSGAGVASSRQAIRIVAGAHGGRGSQSGPCLMGAAGLSRLDTR
jgi:hypothetical protein